MGTQRESLPGTWPLEATLDSESFLRKLLSGNHNLNTVANGYNIVRGIDLATELPLA